MQITNGCQFGEKIDSDLVSFKIDLAVPFGPRQYEEEEESKDFKRRGSSFKHGHCLSNHLFT